MNKIDVRLVAESDSLSIFEWRNDALTRKMFRTSNRVSWDEHSNWLTSTLSNPNRCLLMCETEKGEPIAVVRFDIEDNYANLSINISPLKRGKGYASKCLSLAVNYFEFHFPLVSELVAEIKTINLPSKKSFERVGFILKEERDGYWYLLKKK